MQFGPSAPPHRLVGLKVYSWIPYQAPYCPNAVNMVRSLIALYDWLCALGLHDLGARINIVRQPYITPNDRSLANTNPTKNCRTGSELFGLGNGARHTILGRSEHQLGTELSKEFPSLQAHALWHG